MMQVLLAVEIVIAIFLVAVILMQRSEGGALGMGGGAGVGGLMSARGAGNLLTRATAILAFAFIGIALALAVLAGQRGDGTSVFDDQVEGAAPALEEETGGLDDTLPALDDFQNEDNTDQDQPLADPEDDGEEAVPEDTSGE